MSATDSPATRTARLSGRRRVPRQARQGSSARYGRRSSNASPPASASSSVGTGSSPSRLVTRLRRYGTTPGKPCSSPYSSTSRAACGSSATGTSSEKPLRSATSTSASRSRRGPWRCQGRIAPSRMLFDSSGMTRAASTTQRWPSPSHAGQAPWALLNENARGLSSGTCTSQRAQARCCESSRSPRPSTDTSTTPRASWSAFSRLWRRRSPASARSTRRSTSTSIRCPRRGSSSSLSPRFAACPSMRARCSPAWRAAWSSLR